MKINCKEYKALIFIMKKDCPNDKKDREFVKECAEEFFERDLIHIHQIAEKGKHIPHDGSLKASKRILTVAKGILDSIVINVDKGIDNKDESFSR